MRAHIIAVGDELLIGQVVNTNASWLGDRLTAIGVDILRVLTIGDDQAGISQAVAGSMEVCDLVIVTGGLGPTHDDVTKEAVADCFGVGLQFDEAIFAELRARYEHAGRRLSDSNRSQAEVPEGFEALRNAVGTAPGLLRDSGDCLVVVLPGVPREMKGLMEDHVIPRLISKGGLATAARKTLLTTGIAESSLHDAIGDLDGWAARGCALAYLPSVNGVRLRLTSTAGNPSQASDLLAEFESFVRNHAGRHLYGEGEQSLEELVGDLLRAREWTVAVAESCTGGLVGSRLTDVPGSSDYVRGGVVAYDNAVKREVLGVSGEQLRIAGAVSEGVVIQMAEGVRRMLGTDVGLATSGILGPGGGSEDKPVGTVWIVAALPGGTRTQLLHLRHDRLGNKERTATAVLNLLRLALPE